MLEDVRITDWEMAMNHFKSFAFACTAGLFFASAASAQYPQPYCPPSPYNYPGPAGPMRPPQPFVGSSYSFVPPNTSQYYSAPYTPGYYPVYSSFYDPRNMPVNAPPGPYWYTQNYPYTSGYYSYYYTPGYFRY
jgi:hypothetical protein